MSTTSSLRLTLLQRHLTSKACKFFNFLAGTRISCRNMFEENGLQFVSQLCCSLEGRSTIVFWCVVNSNSTSIHWLQTDNASVKMSPIGYEKRVIIVERKTALADLHLLHDLKMRLNRQEPCVHWCLPQLRLSIIAVRRNGKCFKRALYNHV